MQTFQTPPQAAQWLREKVTGQLHIDSRKVKQGDGFFAWPGLTQDARQYVAQALSQGASVCLVEAKGIEQFPWMNEETRVGVYTDLKQACGPIADAYFESPSQNLQMLAVTGTMERHPPHGGCRMHLAEQVNGAQWLAHWAWVKRISYTQLG